MPRRLTQAEANTKWCAVINPAAAPGVPTGDPIATNEELTTYLDTQQRGGTPAAPIIPDRIKCIASFCAIWEWDDNFSGDADVSGTRTGHCAFVRGNMKEPVNV